MTLEKTIFKVFPITRLWKLLIIGPGQGRDWQDLCRRPLDTATH